MQQVSPLAVLLRSASQRAKGECSKMAAAHISMEEGLSSRQYHSYSSIPTEASAKVIHTGPKSGLKTSKSLGALFREIWRRFPRLECQAWNHLSMLFLF